MPDPCQMRCWEIVPSLAERGAGHGAHGVGDGALAFAGRVQVGSACTDKTLERTICTVESTAEDREMDAHLPANGKSWLARFGCRPVVFSSPHPGSECLQRLARVTTRRGFISWYTDPRNAGRPGPRLRGDAGPSRIFVAPFEDAAGRNSFAAWLDARLEPVAGGGTTLTGKIGLYPGVRGMILGVAGIGGLIVAGAVAGGTVLLVHGQPSGLLAVLAAPVMIAGFGGLIAVGLRSLERGIPKLIEEINGTLDSTATFTDPTRMRVDLGSG